MTKILSFFLALTILFTASSLMTSCVILEAIDAKNDFKDPDTNEKDKPNSNDTLLSPENSDSTDTSLGAGNPNESEKDSASDSVKLPSFEEIDIKKVNFDQIIYVRPDCEGTVATLKRIALMIQANEGSFESQLSELKAFEDDYADFLTMYTYAEIMTSIDSSDKYWADEFTYLSESYPHYSEAIEDIFISCANSVHAKRFEDEYFGPGLIAEYKNGGIYTDEVTALTEKEAELESRYLSLSTANVTITYGGRTDTFDNVMSFYESTYGKDSFAYTSALNECTALYEEAVLEISTDILVELFTVRRSISDALGYDSYAKIAYKEFSHDYTEKELFALIDDVKNYIIPLYNYLNSFIFYNYFASFEKDVSISKSDLLLNVEKLFSTDEDLSKIYEYLTECGLYNIDTSSPNRFSGAFTTYFEGAGAPFLFVTLNGDITDYMSLSHEFGHYADYLINYGYYSSLDLSEVYSTALELLMLEELKESLSYDEYKYLRYYRIQASLQALVFQTLFALFEHYAYAIESEFLSEKTLTIALEQAAKDLGLPHKNFDSLDAVLIPQIITAPFYVQSYTVAEVTSLGIYLMEIAEEQKGLNAYKDLLYRENHSLKFEEYLELAGIPSPFTENYLKYLGSEIHYLIVGSHCYK